MVIKLIYKFRWKFDLILKLLFGDWMADLNVRPETLVPFDCGWLQPHSDEIKHVLNFMNYSGSKAGKLVGVSSRTIRKWIGGESPIPFAAWAILIESAIGLKIWKVNIL